MSTDGHKDYPMMIFHISQKPIIINNSDELNMYLAKGWKQDPFQINEIDRLNKEINWHEEEGRRLQEELDTLTAEMNIVPTVSVPVSSLVKGQGHDEMIPPVPVVETKPDEVFEDGAEATAPAVAPVEAEVAPKVKPQRIRK
jgi:hypothetical protein